MDSAEALRRFTIGRIIYCVLVALPLILFFRLLIDPGETKDERFSDFLQTWLLIFIDVLIVMAGIATVLTQRVRQKPVLFWLVATLVAAIPILFGIGLIFLAAL